MLLVGNVLGQLTCHTIIHTPPPTERCHQFVYLESQHCGTRYSLSQQYGRYIAASSSTRPILLADKPREP
jgi:hypothetical protein